jgi:alpha-D-xyloside xylohydrolase
MFGPSLLINPVCGYRQYNRSVYLPKSEGWYDLYSGKFFTGGQKISADAPYERMPVFVKAGSIVPFGPELQYTSEKKADTVILNVYTGADVTFNLYEDEGTNYNYEKGNFSIIPIKYNEQTQTISIGERKGEFDGMLKKRIFCINIISSKNAKPLQFGAYDKIIRYEGENSIIKL